MRRYYRDQPNRRQGEDWREEGRRKRERSQRHQNPGDVMTKRRKRGSRDERIREKTSSPDSEAEDIREKITQLEKVLQKIKGGKGRLGKTRRIESETEDESTKAMVAINQSKTKSDQTHIVHI